MAALEGISAHGSTAIGVVQGEHPPSTWRAHTTATSYSTDGAAGAAAHGCYCLQERGDAAGKIVMAARDARGWHISQLRRRVPFCTHPAPFQPRQHPPQHMDPAALCEVQAEAHHVCGGVLQVLLVVQLACLCVAPRGMWHHLRTRHHDANITLGSGLSAASSQLPACTCDVA